MIVLSQLSKHYGDKELFSDVSVRFPDAGVVGLVGPNGAGKSTLLRILIGEETPDAGDVAIPRGARVAYLGQEVEEYGEGRVLDVVLLPFAEILRMEQRLAELAQAAAESDDLDAVLAEMADVQEAFERAEGYSLIERARGLLMGLGFDEAMIEGPMSALSGGWRMRAVLAQLLLQRPEILLLDEPTNHLDIDAILWLETFLSDWKGLVIMTSHDRAFLDRMCGWIAAFEFGTLRLEKGNYSAYEASLELRMEQAEKEADIARREKERLEKFVERFRAKATKARQAQSRAKQIERIEIPEVRNPRPPRMQIRFVDVPRAPRTLVTFEEVSKAFGERVVFDRIDWRLERDQKVAVVGPNGAGKTTMLRLLTGDLKPDGGRVRRGEAVEMAWFAQHHLEALEPEDSVIDTILNRFPDATIGEARAVLGGVLFSGNDVKKKVRVLSGGERARLMLALIFFRGRNLLVFDEPTNHLDMASIDVLAGTLRAWQGTVVVVSHDRAFLNRFVDHVVDLHPGRFVTYPGNMSDYEWHWQQRLAAAAPAPPAATKPDAGGNERQQRKQEQAQRRKIEKAFRACVDKVQAVEQEIAALRAKLEDPANATDHEQLWKTQQALDEARAREARLMQEWERLVEEGERLGLDLMASV